MPDVLINAEEVSKKFCKNLKKSMLYGINDIAMSMIAADSNSNRLRKEEFWAVNNISFEVRRGECLGLIGPNGSGKSTLLKMFNGIIEPDKGRIQINGKVGALIEVGAGFHPILTGRENIYVNGSILGFTKKELDKKFDAIVDFAGLHDFIDMPVKNYSSGMFVRLGFAIAAQMQPDVLLIDEILAVGDAQFRVKCFNHIQELIGKSAVIFVSHNMAQISRICNRLLYLRHGEKIAEGVDVGEIIAEYNSFIEIENKPVAEGSGKAIIHSVKIQDKFGNEGEELIYGEPFSIVFKMEIPKIIDGQKYALLITISDQGDSNVAQIYEPLPLITEVGILSVKLNIENMQLNAGRYWLTTSILIGDRGELACVLRQAASINVKNTYVGYAPVIFSCSGIELERVKGHMTK